MKTGLVKLAAGVAMGVDVHHADGPAAPYCFHDRVGNGMVPAHGERKHGLVYHQVVPGLKVFHAHGQAVAAAKRHITHVCHPQRVHRGDLQHVVIGADALNGAHGARAKAGAGAVAGTQVHGRAHECYLQIAKIRRLGVYRAGGG